MTEKQLICVQQTTVYTFSVSNLLENHYCHCWFPLQGKTMGEIIFSKLKMTFQTTIPLLKPKVSPQWLSELRWLCMSVILFPKRFKITY